ncbi:MAG TPA: NAD-dependent epimerase/dehydratase family protein [Candidatus Deferrimicrobium sp.]|nr:NAD-dependent epimerase/dehydratase family protein [Candidatus Deferrimicrobium sp.]
MDQKGMNQDKLFLVDGAKGHTGSFLVRELLDTYSNCKIIATDLPTDTRKEVMTKEAVFRNDIGSSHEFLKDPRIQFFPSDLTKSETLTPLLEGKKFDVIFHPASLYDYFAELEHLRRINVEGTENLLRTIIDTQDLEKLRFIHWSTCGVYGEPKYLKDKKGYPIPADETFPFNPSNDYSISKMEQELVVKKYHEEHGLKMTIIRPAPIYGPEDTYGGLHIMQTLSKTGFSILAHIYPRKKKLALPLIHVKDLVRAAIFLSENEKAIGETYNAIANVFEQDEVLEYIYRLLSVRYYNIPIWWPLYKLSTKILFAIAGRKQNQARKQGIRPKFDLPMVGYLKQNFRFSNKKVVDLGFEFLYPDYHRGIKEVFDWYIEHKWVEREVIKWDS